MSPDDRILSTVMNGQTRVSVVVQSIWQQEPTGEANEEFERRAEDGAQLGAGGSSELRLTKETEIRVNEKIGSE
jgi:hypothetical protein